MTKDEILRLARERDPEACWASDDVDENCLLIEPDEGFKLLLGGGWLDGDYRRLPDDAYEDRNPPGSTNTRLVFPSL